MEKKHLIIILAINFSILWILEPVRCENSKPCVARRFEYDSIVCVCNSTYCDFPPEMDSTKNQVYVYESNKSGKRFDLRIANVSRIKVSDFNQLFLNLTRRFQNIFGFGGAFTDSSGINIKNLTNATQDMLLQQYFSKRGSRYNIGRVPIAGTDFSERPYTYNELNKNETDVDLKKFALQEEDYKYKIPIIQRAIELNSDLLFVGTAWSAPTWMKTNHKINDIGFLKMEYYQTYVEYLIKFLDEYKKHNISFWALSTGNEPNNIYVMDINSMGWTPSTMGKWVTANLGPTLMASAYKKLHIHVLDDQRLFLPWYVKDMALEFPDVTKFAKGIAVHWYWDKYLSPIRLDETIKLFPGMYILITEACTGFIKNDQPKVQLGSWERGEFYIVKMIENINHGVSGWIDWNLALNKHGGPNWRNNFVDAPIIVNPETDEFYKQPLFYSISHFSRFVPPKSVRLNITESENVKATAFETPEKSVVIVLCNTGHETEKLSIVDSNEHHINLELSPFSWHTVLYNPIPRFFKGL